MPTISDFERMLRDAQLRVTRPRLAVLSAVRDTRTPTPTHHRAVRDDLGAVSHQAVYDVLRALTDARLVRRIQPPGSVARYEARVGDNHHHLVCRACGAIADVDCAVGHAPCLTASDDPGFEIDEAEVIYWGRCPAASPQPHRTDRQRERPHVTRPRQRKREPGNSSPRPEGRPAAHQPGLVAEPARPAVLHQHSAKSNPLGADFDYAERSRSSTSRR